MLLDFKVKFLKPWLLLEQSKVLFVLSFLFVVKELPDYRRGHSAEPPPHHHHHYTHDHVVKGQLKDNKERVQQPEKHVKCYEP